jgi:hypothetical protein
MDERRRSRRATPAHDVKVTIGGHRPARLIDVTPDGARLELASALNPRGECQIALPLPAGLLRIKTRVVHCKLVGFARPGISGELVYRAGVQFVDVDPKLAVSIADAYPAPSSKPLRSGPIKVKVNLDALERAVETGKHGAN